MAFDHIHPIGSPYERVVPVRPVQRRTKDEQEREDEEQRRARREAAQDVQAETYRQDTPRPVRSADDDDDGVVHVDFRA